MGFGVLFIGYFLLLNFANAALTDAIAAALILYGLSALAPINREFRLSSRIAMGFLAIGAVELVLMLLDKLFFIGSPDLLVTALGALKYLSVGALSFFMLRGMRSVSREVRLLPLSYKCEQVAILVIPIYEVFVLLEVLGLLSVFDAKIMATVAAICIVCSLVLTVMVLYLIYSCYAKICMPGERQNASEEKKPSKIGFVNAFRAHEEEKRREYAEYRLEKMRRKAEKKKEKSNKNGKK